MGAKLAIPPGAAVDIPGAAPPGVGCPVVDARDRVGNAGAGLKCLCGAERRVDRWDEADVVLSALNDVGAARTDARPGARRSAEPTAKARRAVGTPGARGAHRAVPSRAARRRVGPAGSAATAGHYQPRIAVDEAADANVAAGVKERAVRQRAGAHVRSGAAGVTRGACGAVEAAA
jgi:hypothetical protein